MLTGSRFARASYALFAVAVMLALLKLSGVTGAKLLFLKVAPATPVAKAVEPASKRNAPENETLDLPDADGLALESAVRSPDGSVSRSVGERHAAPVFYRPSTGMRGKEGDPVCGNLDDFPKGSRVVFPLPEDYFDSYEDTWGAARPQGGHEGTDLMSPTRTPELAITDGTLVPVKGANGNGWNRLGGYTAMLEAAYDAGPIKKGDLFYYAHMDEESALPVGTKVRAGQQIGVVGDTGEGREVTRGRFPPHLHLGWYDAGGSEGRTNLESGAMNPYPLLLWLEAHRGSVSGGTDASYCEAPQEPAPEPTDTSSDLDTGDPYDARPTPIIGDNQSSSERESGTDDASGEEDKRAGATSGNPGADPAGGIEIEDGVEDERDEERASRLSTGNDPLQARVRQGVRSLLPGSSWPSYGSVLADVSGETEGREERNGRDANAPDVKGPKEPPRQPGGGDGSPQCGSLQGGSSAERYVYITRANDSVPDRRASIRYGEWLKAVRSDSEMRMSRSENKGLAVWVGHPDRKKIRFDLCGRSIAVESPDGPTVEKMREIAGALDARVKKAGEER